MRPIPNSTFLLLLYCITDQIHQCHAFTATSPPPISSKTNTRTVAASSNADGPETLSLFSPCKINLFLRIIRKRPDGYHDLASLFQAIGFGDSLDLTKIQGVDRDEFTCNMEGVPTDSSNLVIRALELMREKTGMQQFFRANLIKQVPAQAGLGGGSANAATAMWGANELMGRPASLDDLVQWSGEIGSDITFFLSRGTAYCTGRGEIMDTIDPPLPSGTKVCIVKPNVGLSTPAVFKALDYETLSTIDPDKELLPSFLHGIDDVPNEFFINDLELPAFKCVPELATLKQQLLGVDGFDHVMMSGSGSSIFCLGEPKDRERFESDFGARDDLKIFFSEFVSRKDDAWYEQR